MYTQLTTTHTLIWRASPNFLPPIARGRESSCPRAIEGRKLGLARQTTHTQNRLTRQKHSTFKEHCTLLRFQSTFCHGHYFHLNSLPTGQVLMIKSDQMYPTYKTPPIIVHLSHMPAQPSSLVSLGNSS